MRRWRSSPRESICDAWERLTTSQRWRGSVWAPGYLREERIVKVETLVYSLEDDQLVWAGVSRTFEPLQIESFISELAAAVSEEMARGGLIAGR